MTPSAAQLLGTTHGPPCDVFRWRRAPKHAQQERVLAYNVANPAPTQVHIMSAFGAKFFDATPKYGAQRKAARLAGISDTRGPSAT